MNTLKTLQGRLEYYLPDWRQRCYEARASGKRWLRKIKGQCIKLIVLYLAVVLCFVLVFGMANYFWFLVRHTPVGVMFLDRHPPEALLAVFAATEKDLLPQAIRLTFDTAVTCLLLGLACQVLAITRCLYTGRGLVNRLAWFLLCAAITSLDVLGRGGQRLDFTTGLVLHLLPASCLTGSCLEFTAILLPEVWIVFKLKELRQFYRVAKVRNASCQPNMPGRVGDGDQ